LRKNAGSRSGLNQPGSTTLLKKYRFRRFAPSLVRFLDQFPQSERFFSPYNKNLSPCGKLNDIDGKQHKSAIFTMRELAKDKLSTLYFLNFEIKTKMLTYKTSRRMPRKFPAIQCNKPNVVLFHESIPSKALPY
jgi:hypothetical protein